MIIREWRGRASPSRAEAYPAHFRTHVLPELAGIAGFLGAQLSKRRVGDVVEFLVLTRWESIDSIRGFAGSDIARSVVEPAGAAALLDFDPNAQHYEIIEEVSAG